VEGMGSNRLFWLNVDEFFDALIHSSSEIQYYLIGVIEGLLDKENFNEDEMIFSRLFVEKVNMEWKSKDSLIDFALYKYHGLAKKCVCSSRKAPRKKP
jgi:hypothetical protein